MQGCEDGRMGGWEARHRTFGSSLAMINVKATSAVGRKKVRVRLGGADGGRLRLETYTCEEEGDDEVEALLEHAGRHEE